MGTDEFKQFAITPGSGQVHCIECGRVLYSAEMDMPVATLDHLMEAVMHHLQRYPECKSRAIRRAELRKAEDRG